MLIKNAILIDGASIFEEKRDIRITDGKIEAVAEALESVKGEEVWDANGSLITPGFIESNCQVGIHSQIFRNELNDASDVPAVSPEMRAYDALNLADEAFDMALDSGVTCVITGPGQENLIGGTQAAVKTAAVKKEGHLGTDDRVMVPEVSYLFNLTNAARNKFGSKGQCPSTRMASAAMIRAALLKAKEYHRKKKAGEKQEFKMDLDALSRVFDGMPVQISAMHANDIMTAVRIGEEFGLNYIIVNAYDILTACQDMGRNDFKFIVGPLYGISFSEEAAAQSIDLAAEIEKAGIHAAITTGHPEMNIDLAAAQLVLLTDRGMSRKEAILSVTRYPAEIMGLSDRIGTLEPGKDADLVIWEGDPLTYEGSPLKVMIEGTFVR